MRTAQIPWMWSLSHGGAGAKRTANHTAIWALQARFSGNQGMWPGRNLPSSCDLSSFSKACATAGLELSCAGCAVMPASLPLAAYRSLGFTPCCCCSAGTWANQSTARSRGVHGEMCVLIHRNTQKLTGKLLSWNTSAAPLLYTHAHPTCN